MDWIALSCIISEIKQDICGASRFLYYPIHSPTPRGGSIGILP